MILYRIYNNKNTQSSEIIIKEVNTKCKRVIYVVAAH